MSSNKTILIVAILLCFAAGGAVGLLVGRASPPAAPAYQSPVEAELNLTPEQTKQWQQIRAEYMNSQAASRPSGDKRSAIRQKRDEDVQALLTDSQKAKYEQIQKEYSQAMEQLGRERRKAMDEVVERAKKILTPEQAAKYDQWLKKQRERWGGGRGRHRGTAPASGSATQSESAPHGAE